MWENTAMTSPDDRMSPYAPGQPSAYTSTPAYPVSPVPPQPYAAPAGYPAPMPAGPPPKPVSARRVFWTRGPGVIVLVVAVGLVLFGLAALSGLSGSTAKPRFTVAVTSCDTTGDATLTTATVGFTVTNTGKTTRSAQVSIEYRDGAGNRIDTDTSYVRGIAPGDTARSQESTILDAAPDGATRCVITDVS